VSERALADGGAPEDESDQRQGRILDGYDRVPAALAASLPGVRLSHVVREIAWEPGRVEVRYTTSPAHGTHATIGTVTARCAILTVPLSVLQQTTGESCDCLLAGHRGHAPSREPARDGHRGPNGSAVPRAVLGVERPSGAGTGGRSLAELAFLHSSDDDVPVWWTASPVRAATLVGWAGGGKAERLAAHGAVEIEHRAIAALARQLGMQRRHVASLIDHCWHHDWLRDPYTLGAYSYALVGGSTAAKRLARPVENTLFFAGEAADAEAAPGTVHGAMGTGYRAADSVLRLTMD
jgi:monoamine oxidase